MSYTKLLKSSLNPPKKKASGRPKTVAPWAGSQRIEKLGHNIAKYSKNPKIKQNTKRVAEQTTKKAMPIKQKFSSVRALFSK